MLVPEAAVHEYDLPATREDQVRRSQEVRQMEAVAVAQGVHAPAHHHLGLRAFRPDSGYDLASARRVYDVGHSTNLTRAFLRQKDAENLFEQT